MQYRIIVFMSDIADESSQQINAGKGYKSVVLEDATWEQIYSQAKVIFSDTPCSWIQLMWNNVGERKNKSKWHLKGKWKFKISSPGSIFCAEGFGWERAPIPLAIMKIRLQRPTLLLGQRGTSVCSGQGSSTLCLSAASRCCSALGFADKPLL